MTTIVTRVAVKALLLIFLHCSTATLGSVSSTVSVSDRVSDQVRRSVSDGVSDGVSDRVRRSVSDGVSDGVSDRVSDRVSERVSDSTVSSPHSFTFPIDSLTTHQADTHRLQWEHHCLLPHNTSSNHTLTHSHTPSQHHYLNDNCVVQFLHIHKTGGTTMCNTAKMNGFRVTGHNNCNTPVAVSVYDQAHPELGLTQQYAFDHNLTFIGQEHTLFLPNISTNRVVHMVTVRHPADRLISHIHHTMCEGTVANAERCVRIWNCSTIKDVRTAKLSDIILDPCFQSANPGLYAITTDFYIDMIMKCRHRRCTTTDMRLAMKRLHFFSAIMITDTPEQYDK
jgi:hypothetical protein